MDLFIDFQKKTDCFLCDKDMLDLEIFTVVFWYEHKHTENLQICTSVRLSINDNLIIKS